MRIGGRGWRVVLAIVAGAGLSACKSWQPVTVSPAALFEEERPSRVRVTDEAGREVTLRNPVLRNDSIVVSESGPAGFPARSFGVPTGEVTTLAVPRFNAGKTIAFTAIGLAVGVAWARSVGDSDGGSTDFPPGPDKGIAFSLDGALGLLLGLMR